MPYRVGMALPQDDVALIMDWCDMRTPERSRSTLWIEAIPAPRHVTLEEVWIPPDGIEIRSPFARLRYLKKDGTWSVYWADQYRQFHRYPDAPVGDVLEVLAFINADPDRAFFG